MNPSTEISPSTQLLLDEIRKLSDKFDARWAKQDAARGAFWGVPVPTQFAAVRTAIVADNWGGFFDGGDDSIEQHCATPPIVADNWGGLFEQPAHTPEERDLLWSDPFPMGTEWADSDDRDVGEVHVPLSELLSSTPDGLVSGEVTHGSELESDLACPEQLTVDAAAIESTSTDPDTRICVTPTPTASAAVSTSVKANTPVETSPTQYQRQIQELEKPSSSSFPAAAAKEEVLRAIPLCGYIGSFGPEFVQAVEKKQVAQQEAERPEFLVARAKQERHVAIVRVDGLGASSRVFVGVHIQRFHNDFAPDDLDLLCCVRLGPVECALHATLLGGYDGSLDDDPESGFAHFVASLDRGVGRGRLALAATAAHRADAVGAAGGGQLAWVVAAGPAQTNCSMVCPAGDSYFADIPVDVLWEEEMLQWGANNHGLAPVPYMDELEVVAGAEPARTQPWLPGLAALYALRAHYKEKGCESDILKGFSILKQEGGGANSGNRCTSRLESFHSDAESNAGLDLNAARRALTMCIITTGRSLSLVDGHSMNECFCWPWKPPWTWKAKCLSSVRTVLTAIFKIRISTIQEFTVWRCFSLILLPSAWWNSRCQCEVLVSDHSISRISSCVFDRGTLHTFLEQHCIAFRSSTCHDQWDSVPLLYLELLVDYELSETRIARDDSLQPSAIVPSELYALHSISLYCIYYRLAHPIWLLKLLFQLASTSLLLQNGSAGVASLLVVGTARWMTNILLLHERKFIEVPLVEMKALLDYNLTSVLVLDMLLATTCLFKVEVNRYTTCCIELQPWPPPAILHTNITRQLVVTISVSCKLNVLDHVTLAASDLIELGYDDFHRFFVKKLVSTAMDRHDKEKEIVSVLLSYLSGNMVSSAPVRLGLVLLLEVVGDLAVDIPDVIDVLAPFITCAVVDDILSPAFLNKAKVSLSGSSKGMQVVQIAENSSLSAHHYAELIARQWVSSTHITVEEVVKRVLTLGMESPAAEALIVKFLKEAFEEVSSAQFVKSEPIVKNATAPPPLPKDAGRQLCKQELMKHTIIQLPWDPGGSILLYRLGGKPNFKERGMLATSHGWAVAWAMDLEPSPEPSILSFKHHESLYRDLSFHPHHGGARPFPHGQRVGG